MYMCVCVFVSSVCGCKLSSFYSQLHSDFALLRIMEVADSFKEYRFQKVIMSYSRSQFFDLAENKRPFHNH